MSGRPLDHIRSGAPVCLAALFGVSGVLHLVRPGRFLPLVPEVLPARTAIVLGSGVAEIACAAGLLTRARWAGMASALLLVAVFPGNVSFAIHATRTPSRSPLLLVAAWVRLPIQMPLIWAALQARRRRQ